MYFPYISLTIQWLLKQHGRDAIRTSLLVTGIALAGIPYPNTERLISFCMQYGRLYHTNAKYVLLLPEQYKKVVVHHFDFFYGFAGWCKRYGRTRSENLCGESVIAIEQPLQVAQR